MSKNNDVQPDTPGSGQYPWNVKIACVLGVGLLQTVLFFLTYQLYHLINYPFYIDLETWLDGAVPYIAWSWVFYYFGFFYIFFWGTAGVWRMEKDTFKRTIKVYVWLILTGGVLHLMIPSDAPWPLVSTLSATQHSFKSAFSIEPLAGFPSMHAAMAVLPALISLYTYKSVMLRGVSVILSLLVCISVVTAKEHWAIDVPAGMLLGLLAAWGWRHYAWSAGNSQSQKTKQIRLQEQEKV